MAQQSDMEHVLSLYESVKSSAFCVWNDNYPTISEIQHDLETNNLYVMTDGGNIIGAISVVPENELDGFDCWSCKDGKEIARVVIHKAYQGRRLAFAMVQKVEAILRQRGQKSILFWSISSSNRNLCELLIHFIVEALKTSMCRN